MKGRAFVSGAVIWQYASHHQQSPAVSSLGQTEGESKPTTTATAMTS